MDENKALNLGEKKEREISIGSLNSFSVRVVSGIVGIACLSCGLG